MVAPFANDPQSPAKLITRGIIIAGTVLVLSAWMVTAVSIIAARQQDLHHTEVEARNFATAFADEVGQTLNNVAGAMELVAQRMRAAHTANGTFDIYTWAREIPLLSDATIQSAIIGPDGRLVSTTLGPVPEPIDLSDREHFRIHLDGTFPGMFISRPVTGRVSHQVTIQVTRRVGAADGTFLGVILFSLAPGQLTSLHKAIELGPHDVILLSGLDNVIRARFTREQHDGLAGVGQSISGGPRPDEFAENAGGSYVRRGMVDGVERVLGYHRVGNYPLVATVGLDLDEALAPFYRYAVMLGGFTGVATLVLAGLGVYLIREIRWRRAREIELSQAHATLAAANLDLEGDVIRRAELEQQLRETMEHLDRVQRIAGIGSTTEDLATSEYTWSPGACAIFGINTDGVGNTAEFMRQFYHPADRAKVMEAAELARLRGVPAPPLEYRIIRPDGTVRWVYRENDMQYDPPGHAMRRIVTFKDITEIKATEARLQQTQEDLNRAQRLAKMGSDVWDLRTGQVTWSDGAYRIFGVDPDRFIPTSENFLDLVVPEDRPALLAQRKEILQGVCPPPAEFSVRRPDGDVRRIYTEAELIRGANGEPIRWVGMRQDITEQARIECSLRDAKDAAEAANLAKSQFLANVSHELRTPLNAIIGFSEMLERGLAGPIRPKQREYAGLVHQSGQHLLNVINDILDLAHVESGKFELREEAGVDLRDIIEACIALMRDRATAGNLRLSMEIKNRLPLLLADPTRLKQILLNLMSNAIKFTEPGGSVVVAADRTADDNLELEVRDTGLGMTPDEIDIALEPFGQVDAGHTRRHEGTGLGLPLARRLAELHGGGLHISSARGRGTTATVTLPASQTAGGTATITACVEDIAGVA